MMPALPVELQLHILTDVFENTYACDSYKYSTESAVYNFPLATAFLAARTSASPPPVSAVTAFQPGLRIQEYEDPLLLRASLAAALPTWRGALCGIPEMWAAIIVPLDDGSWTEPKAVLSAVQEALDCSKGYRLNVVLTHAPIDDNAGGISAWESERVRVLQVMTLLVPHIARWHDLRVYTLYPASLPVPTLDFAGEAPELAWLALRATLSAPTEPAVIASGAPCPFDVPALTGLTMDVHAFRTAYLHKPDALPAVCNLTLCGTTIGGVDTDSSPAMSVRALLTCVAQMRGLRNLLLQGAHLSTGGEEGKVESGFTPLRRLTRLQFARMPSTVLGEVLNLILAGSDDDDDYEDVNDEGEEEEVRHNLEIIECPLPHSPLLWNSTAIELRRIAPSEDIPSFFTHADSCTSLTVEDCSGFSLERFAEGFGDDVSLGPQWSALNDLGKTWLVPRLEELFVDNCAGVEEEAVQQVVRNRRQAFLTGADVDEVDNALLDSKLIEVEEEDEPRAYECVCGAHSEDYAPWIGGGEREAADIEPNMLMLLLGMSREIMQQT